MDKYWDLEKYYFAYQAIGKQIIVNACSAAILAYCRSPVVRKTEVFEDSLENLEFINDSGIEQIATYYLLDLDVPYLKDQFFVRANFIRTKHYAQNSSI